MFNRITLAAAIFRDLHRCDPESHPGGGNVLKADQPGPSAPAHPAFQSVSAYLTAFPAVENAEMSRVARPKWGYHSLGLEGELITAPVYFEVYLQWWLRKIMLRQIACWLVDDAVDLRVGFSCLLGCWLADGDAIDLHGCTHQPVRHAPTTDLP